MSEFDKRFERIGKGFMYHISGRIADDIGSIFVKVDNRIIPWTRKKAITRSLFFTNP